MKNVVVFAGTAIGNVLSLVKILKKEFNINTYVVCLNSSYSSVFNASIFVTESVEIFGKSNSELLESFKQWVKNKSFGVKPILYFTTDNSCLFVNNNRKWFEENFELTLPSSNIVNTYNFKGIAEVNAAKNGLLVPRTIIINTFDDINTIQNSFNFPVIIKPTSTLTKKEIGFKVKVIRNKGDLKQEAEYLINSNKSIICQEYIPGKDEKAYYYIFYRNSRGEVFENIGIKKLQNPPSRGVMAIGISHYNDKISKISKSFLEKINYIGIGGIEYKQYKGDYFFIEMSTRLEGFHLITEISNIPISKISYLDLSELPIKNICNKQIDGIKYIDVLLMFAARKNQKKYGRFLYDLFIAFFDRRTHSNFLSIDDFKPFIATLKKKLYGN